MEELIAKSVSNDAPKETPNVPNGLNDGKDRKVELAKQLVDAANKMQRLAQELSDAITGVPAEQMEPPIGPTMMPMSPETAQAANNALIGQPMR